MEIVKPLFIQLGCRWIKQGIFDITSPSLSDKVTIDSGPGDCDNFATLTYSDKTKEINL